MDIDRAATPLETDSSVSDGDSAISDVSPSFVRTTSVTSSVYNYQYDEKGRRYHAYDAGVYMLPNDDQEQDRLDLQHHIFRLCVDGALFLAPIPKDVHHVADLGCGTGIWAIEFADDHPSATVLGVDLSPIQPSHIPSNCSFRVDNVEADWMPEEKFDFIHSRAMVGAVNSWPRLLEQAFEHLKPGGYLELQDVMFPMVCNNPDGSDSSKLVHFSRRLMEAGSRIGLDFQAPGKWHDLLTAAGFEDIEIKWVNWPIGPWAKLKKNKIIGKLVSIDYAGGIDGTAKLLQNALGLKPEDVQVIISQAKAELTEQKVHLYQQVAFCYARKPM